MCGNVERVGSLLLAQARLALAERGTKEGVAIACHNDLVGAKVKSQHFDMALGNGEAIYHGIVDVLALHAFNDVGNDGIASCIMVEQTFDSGAAGEQLLCFCSTFGGMSGFGGLRIDEELAINKALAVAHHPYLALQSAEDDGRAGEAFFGMLCHAWQQPLAIVMAQISADAQEKLVAVNVFGHLFDIAAC